MTSPGLLSADSGRWARGVRLPRWTGGQRLPVSHLSGGLLRRGDRFLPQISAACFFCVAMVPLALLASFAAGSVTQRTRYSQTDVEAAYLYDFTKFVTWPAALPGSPLTICVAGGGPVLNPLHRLVANTVIGGHPLAIAQVENALDAQSCSVLFLPEANQASHEDLLAMLHGRPVLTVSDSPGFIDGGGMVQFVVRGRRLRFSINIEAANRTGIRISSELLKVALRVRGRPLPEAQP